MPVLEWREVARADLLAIVDYISDDNPDAYDAWFRERVHEALDDTRPAVPHHQVMDEVQSLIDRKRRARP